MAILDRYQFHVASDTTQLDQVLAQCEHINAKDYISRHDWMQCQLAIAEGFTNAVRHAHGEQYKDCPISLDLTLKDHSIEIRIWDYSKQGFDLEQHLANLEQHQVNEQASGGRGFIILKKISSQLAYRYDPERQQNYLLIVKNLMSRLVPYFISADSLRDRLNDSNLVIIDCRFRLNDPAWGEIQYEQGHILGAYYLHLDRDLSAPLQEHGGRHPLPDPAAFISLLSRLGIERERTEIVVYDDSRFAFAARFWWLLKYYGHDNVSLLNGGFAAWQAVNYPTTTAIPTSQPSQFDAKIQSHLLLSREDLLVATDNKRVLIDAREGDRYLGKTEPIDPIAGHIPGAINAPWQQISTTAGYSQSHEQQKELWQNLDLDPAGEIVLYCGSGVTACVDWLSLELAGYKNLKLYAGGWSDWCSYLTNQSSSS